MLFQSIKDIGIYQIGFFKESSWLKVFHHSFENKAFFLNENEASYIISKDKYSILSNITNKFKISHKFEFLLVYPESNQDVYFHWKQSKNPIYDNETTNDKKASGFQHIDKNTDKDYSWGGLVKTCIPANGKIKTFINGNPGIDEWYFAIGMYENADSRWHQEGIPSYINNVGCQYVSLWLKIPSALSGMISCRCYGYRNIQLPKYLFSIFIGLS